MLEDKVITCLNYVELHEDNFSVYSREFAMLIQSSGSELDNMFKLFCDMDQSKDFHITDYKKYISDEQPELVEKIVEIGYNQTDLQPLMNFDKTQKEETKVTWWKAFTLLKHKRNLNFKQATLGNCIHILAALFLLETEYLIRIGKENNEIDVPDQESKLFVLKDCKSKYILNVYKYMQRDPSERLAWK